MENGILLQSLLQELCIVRGSMALEANAEWL